MTDRPEKPRKEVEGPGAQLRRAREARGLLLHDIAQELHLDEWMLQALEEDDFAALGAPVFTKGHMRKYGSMLGLNSDDLMIAYYRKRGRDDSPPPITKMMAPESPGRKLNWLSMGKLFLVLVISFVIFLAWSLLTRETGNRQSSIQPPALSSQSSVQPTAALSTELSTELPDEIPAANPDTGTVGQLIDATGQTTAGPDGELTATVATINPPEVSGQIPANPVSASPDTVAVMVDSPATGSRLVEIRLVLTGESWVEVTDSDGVRLVYDMMKEGRVRTVSGRPPIEVFLGLSRAVQVEVNGQSYSIPRTAIRGNTARFVIDSNNP